VSDSVLTITDQSFADGATRQPGLLLLDVWAGWCGPCRLIAPVIDWAAATYAGRLQVAKADCDANPALVQALGVQGLPTLLLFRDGQVISRHEGVLTQAQLAALVDAHL
jgi:thioredoxin 1